MIHWYFFGRKRSAANSIEEMTTANTKTTARLYGSLTVSPMISRNAKSPASQNARLNHDSAACDLFFIMLSRKTEQHPALIVQ